MELETSISQGIDATDGNEKYDNSCKRILSEKIILAWIMKSCLEEYRHCRIQEITEKYIEGQPQVSQVSVMPDAAPRIQGLDTVDNTITEGQRTFDIKFKALAPTSGKPIYLYINIEAQNKFSPGYSLLKRGIYYCSRLISSQYGTEFIKSEYDKLKKVYSIWVCMDAPRGYANTITRYHMAEEPLIGNAHGDASDYDMLSLVMICLGKEGTENNEGIIRLLSVLLSSEANAAEKKQILQKDFGIQMTQTLEKEVDDMCNLSQGVEARGIKKGIEEGIRALINTLQDFSVDKPTAAQRLEKEFGLSSETATKKVHQYWK